MAWIVYSHPGGAREPVAIEGLGVITPEVPLEVRDDLMEAVLGRPAEDGRFQRNVCFHLVGPPAPVVAPESSPDRDETVEEESPRRGGSFVQAALAAVTKGDEE